MIWPEIGSIHHRVSVLLLESGVLIFPAVFLPQQIACIIRLIVWIIIDMVGLMQGVLEYFQEHFE